MCPASIGIELSRVYSEGGTLMLEAEQGGAWLDALVHVDSGRKRGAVGIS